MAKIDLAELEKRYQDALSSHASIDELFALDDQYYAYLEEQIKENPKNVHALMHFGILSWEPFHDDEKAIEYLGKAIEYDPSNVEARFWLAKYYYHDRCAYEKAKQLLLEALQIDPTRADCLSLLSSIVMDTTEDIHEAIHYEAEAAKYAPDWPMLRKSLARLYLRIRDVKSAEFHVKKALECTPLITKPKNDIEDYYENVITGRSWKNLEEKFKPLIDEIKSLKDSPNAQNLVTKIPKNKEAK